jgi:hypothetical protein
MKTLQFALIEGGKDIIRASSYFNCFLATKNKEYLTKAFKTTAEAYYFTFISELRACGIDIIFRDGMGIPSLSSVHNLVSGLPKDVTWQVDPIFFDLNEKVIDVCNRIDDGVIDTEDAINFFVGILEVCRSKIKPVMNGRISLSVMTCHNDDISVMGVY